MDFCAALSLLGVVLSSMLTSGKRMSPDPISVFAKIMVALRLRYRSLNLHYEAAWTDSWSHRRCLHEHQTLIEAATCAMPRWAGWYVFAVEGDTARQLNDTEDRIVDQFRFGLRQIRPASGIGART